jgi:acyl-coenzyme A synthetase/AMP-(fatty) acid ligase
VYVVDEDLRLLPRGDEGELCIGGVAVSRGYLGAADSTAKCFVPDPFVANAQARMYRTGDVVRWSSDGSLQFVGRRDSQVKIRGFRIELGEIEARLSEHTAVREAVVVARDSATGDKQLVAYVIPAESSNGRLQVEALHQHLSLSLPAYMVPAA